MLHGICDIWSLIINFFPDFYTGIVKQSYKKECNVSIGFHTVTENLR